MTKREDPLKPFKPEGMTNAEFLTKAGKTAGEVLDHEAGKNTERDHVVQYLERTAQRYRRYSERATTSEGKATNMETAQALEVAADTIRRGEHVKLNERFGKG